jgi:hypothetical protein
MIESTMENSDSLAWFGVAVIVVMAAFVIVPYLRGKSDLLTAWNVLLLSIAINTGVGCLEVRYGDWSWPNLQWFQPTIPEMQWCMAANTVFIVALILFYYYNPIPGYFTSRMLVRWPPLNGLTYFYVIAFCGLFVAAAMVTRHITFVSQILNQLSTKAAVFAVVFSFMLWYRNRVNLFWLFFFFGVFLGASFFSIIVSVGRRMLLSMVLGPLLCVYWTSIRYWKPKYCMSALAGVAVVVFLTSLAYNSFRFFHHGHSGEERSTANVLAHVSEIGNTDWTASFVSNKLHYFSQYCVHYSLLAERFAGDGRMPTKPLNTLAFLIAIPIPREIWEEKPETIGITMVRDVVGDPSTNWGVGIAGHGAYEGGMLALVLYAFLVAFGIRFLDDPILSQPTNPFLIANFAAAGPHVLAFARGDFGIMSFEVIKCFVFMIVLAYSARLLFGTVRASQIGPSRLQIAQYRAGTSFRGRATR